MRALRALKIPFACSKSVLCFSFLLYKMWQSFAMCLKLKQALPHKREPPNAIHNDTSGFWQYDGFVVMQNGIGNLHADLFCRLRIDIGSGIIQYLNRQVGHRRPL